MSRGGRGGGGHHGQDLQSLRAKIFVGGLPPSLTNDALKDFFAKWGAVRESQILINRETGRVRLSRA
jgi:heterogeneous nuclear ribonucleoprotein A1/A3